MNIETITAMYTLAILAVFGLPVVAMNVRKPAPTARTVADYKGNLFTHPDEVDCDLTDTTKHMALHIEGYDEEGDKSITVHAPSNGWTHAQIAAHITFNKLDCWNAHLGDTWIGSSEV